MFSFIADKLNVKNLGEILAPSYTPEQELHSAIEDGQDEKFFRLLEELNLSPHTPNSGGNLPIHTAAYYGRVRIIENLLSRGIDVNTAGPRDNTPLHFASSQSQFDTVKFLILNGANPAVRNRNGKTSYDVAKGDNVRQYLLPLQFRHEDPSLAAAMLPPGITPSVDPLAPRPEIAPPPISGMMYNPGAQAPPQAPMNPLYAAPTHSAIPRGPAARINRGEYRPIQADGFGSSVGNEHLTAKYGNTREVKVTAPPPFLGGPTGDASAAVAGPPLTNPDGSNPFSAAARGPPAASPSPPQLSGYQGYSAQPGSVGRRAPPQFKIFNPKIVSNNTAPVGGDVPVPGPQFGQQPSTGQYPPRGPFGAPSNVNLESVSLDSEEVTLSSSASVLQ